MAVAGEHVLVRAAAEPQQAQGHLDAAVVGLDGVGDVAVLVGPAGGIGQGALARQDDAFRNGTGLDAWEGGSRDRFQELVACGAGDRNPGLAAVGAHGVEDAVEKAVARLEAGGRRVGENGQRGEVRGEFDGERVALEQGDARAIETACVQAAAEPVNVVRVGIYGDDGQFRLAGQGLEKVPIGGAVEQGVALGHARLLKDSAGLSGGGRRRCRLLRFVFEVARFGLVRPEGEDTSVQSHGEQLVVRGD